MPPSIQFKFDDALGSDDQARIKGHLAAAFAAGEIIPCKCAVIEAWVYPTIPPDFQASLSCACDVMRPLYSSTPDTE